MPASKQPDERSARANSARQRLMHLCAQATETELAAAVSALTPRPETVDLRPTETGLVMLRGRIGGSGAPFNVGEATVTRATIRLETGETGFSYLLGRSKARARLAAIVDAAGQRNDYRMTLERHLIQPVAERIAHERRVVREETEATRVAFFTLVRGED